MITHKTVHRHHNYLSQLWPDTVWRNQRGNATYVLLHTYRKRGRNKATTYILLHTCRTHDRNKREHQTCIATYCVNLFVDFYELGARSSSNVGRNLAPPNQEVSGKARINPPLTNWSPEQQAHTCTPAQGLAGRILRKEFAGSSKDRTPTNHRHRVRGSRGTELRLRNAAS